MITYFFNIFKILVKKFRGDKHNYFNLENILKRNFNESAPFYFIQVGAWDGKGYDFLYDFVKNRNSYGIVIEPLRDYFEKLNKNYAYNPHIKPVNKAVFSEKKDIQLYRVDPAKTDGLPDWAGGIASINPEHYKNAKMPSSIIITETVPADKLMNIIKENYSFGSINLLQIDVEGYDAEVLKQIDFSKINPDIIRFEYIHLTQQATKEAIRMLKQKYYYCFFDDIDIIALKLMKIKL